MQRAGTTPSPCGQEQRAPRFGAHTQAKRFADRARNCPSNRGWSPFNHTPSGAGVVMQYQHPCHRAEIGDQRVLQKLVGQVVGTVML